MYSLRSLLLFLLLPVSAFGADAKPNTLTRKEIEEGWILLFDGETTFGWKEASAKAKEKPEVEVKNGVLDLIGESTALECTTWFQQFEMTFEFRTVGRQPGLVVLETRTEDGKTNAAQLGLRGASGDDWGSYSIRSTENAVETKLQTSSSQGQSSSSGTTRRLPSRVRFQPGKDGKVAAAELLIRNVKLRPLNTKPLFNGKDLTGWKTFPGEKYKSVFGVTSEGWLNVKNGPGDLRTEGQYDNFVLQLECISNGPALNSGVFFRCIDGEYQNGYEMQIQNGFNDGDRTKPKDAGTGAIYRRVAARKVVPNDKEWFGMTLVADGKRLSTWVNGIQVVDWTDDRPEDNNPRKGAKTAKGHLSIQGHDPTTDLSFRNLRLSETK